MSAISGQLSLQLSKRGNRKRRLSKFDTQVPKPLVPSISFLQRLPETRRKRVVECSIETLSAMAPESFEGFSFF